MNGDIDQQAWDKRSEKQFGEFLLINPTLDQSDDLQWLLHRTYWEKGDDGHRSAIQRCARYAKNYPPLLGRIEPLYMNKKDKQHQLAL